MQMPSREEMLAAASQMVMEFRAQDRVDDLPEDLGFDSQVCASCKSFPTSWIGRNRHCRRAYKLVQFDTPACDDFSARVPASTFGIAKSKLHAYKLKLDELGLRLAEMPAVIEKRKRHWVKGLPQRLATNTVRALVYLVDCQDLTKIGFTSTPLSSRINGLTTGNPFKMRVYALIPGSPALERQLHSQFKDRRIRGEWFKLTPGDRKLIERITFERRGAIVNAEML